MSARKKVVDPAGDQDDLSGARSMPQKDQLVFEGAFASYSFMVRLWPQNQFDVGFDPNFPLHP